MISNDSFYCSAIGENDCYSFIYFNSLDICSIRGKITL